VTLFFGELKRVKIMNKQKVKNLNEISATNCRIQHQIRGCSRQNVGDTDIMPNSEKKDST